MIYEYDELERLLKIDDKTIYFEPRESEVFEELLKHKNEVVTKERIDDILTMGYTWNEHYKNVIIHRIRKKLGDSIEIKTISKIGYKMIIRN